MIFHPVVDRFPIIPALDPAMLMLFAAAFVGTALATFRRPSYGAALLVFFPPFTYEHTVPGTMMSFPKAVLIGVLVGLIGRPGFFLALKRVRMPLIGFGALFVATALSSLGATSRTEVVHELFKWIEYALIFISAYYAVICDPDTRLVRISFELSIAFVCLSALAELFTGAPSGMWIAGVSIPRVAGGLEGPNQLGGYMESAIALLGAFQLFEPNRYRSWLLLIATCTLILTFSRASFAGLLVIILVMLLFKGRRWRFLAPLGAGGIAAAAVIGAMFAAVHLSSQALAASLVRPSDKTGAGAGGVGSRAELWRAAIFFFRRHPVFGVGAGNYEHRLAEAGVYGVRTHANSWYLQALAEGGIVLFSATLFFIASIVTQLYPLARRSPWALAAFAATVGLAVHQIADYLFFYPKVAEPWIALVGIGMAATVVNDRT